MRGKLLKRKRSKQPFSVIGLICFILLIIYSVGLLYPMFWGVMTSVKEQYDFLENPLGFPSTFAFGNFGAIFSNFSVPAKFGDYQVQQNFWQLLLNTLLYVVGSSFVATLVPCIVAYVTSKFPGKFSSIIYAVVIAVMMIPIVGSYPSEITLLQTLGLYNTIWGAWIQKANFLGMYFLVFFAAFKGIPKDYGEAAEIDGAGEVQVFLRIMLPIIRNVFFTVFLIKFVEFWNDYQMPLLYLPGYPTLSYGLYYISNYTTNAISTVPVRMAGCIIVLLPILALFIAFSEKLMGNLTMGGIKG